MNKKIINTADAPAAIGTYSQAVKLDNVLYLSGQIPLEPATMQVVTGGFEQQLHQVFANLSAVIAAGGGSLGDIVKLNIYLTDLSQFDLVNQVMAQYFSEPYPARAAVEVSALPKGVNVEMDAIAYIAS